MAACTSAAPIPAATAPGSSPGDATLGAPMTPAPAASVDATPKATADPDTSRGPPSSGEPPSAGPPSTAPPPASSLHDVIAYVPADTADSIRLVAPDGTGDRLLWEHGLEDPSEVYDVWSLEWSPDARELAFASTHENWCSINASDIFVVAADGAGYRRVTQAPACAELAGFPSGAVRMPIEYASFTGDSFFGFVYVQGAATIVQAALAPGGSSEVVFDSVADFGEGFQQFPSVITGNLRDFALGSLVDVEAGGSVTAPALGLFHPEVSWEPRSPSWSSDGSTLAYAYGFNSLFGIDRDPQPLDFGASLLAEDVAGAPNIVLFLARGPTSDTANQILHQGSTLDATEGIWITAEGSSVIGNPLVSYDVFSTINGLAWLPDGSGFVYSVSEGDIESAEKTGDLLVFDVASAQVTSVVDLEGDFAGLVSVSGDGQSIAFERSDELDQLDESLVDPDLWVVGRDGSGLRLLVEHARAPAWSR